MAEQRAARWRGLIAGILWIGLMAAQAAVTDDRGVNVALDRPVNRVVSLLPSLTETVCELGGCARLVGVDRHSNWPESVRRLPHLGGLEDTDIESLLRLKPDLVLLARSSRVLGKLESLGIKVLALEPQNQGDVQRVMLTLAHALALPDADKRAQQQWQLFQKGVEQAVREVPAAARGALVYFETGQGFYAASESSFIGEVLIQMGLRNIVSSRLGHFPAINPEFVVRADPAFLMLPQAQAQELAQRPGWSAIKAVRKNQLCIYSPQEADLLLRPGPRLAEAAQWMVRCLQRVTRP
jgi:iron complex transport system substrate-binding protein